jgi:hypothetical protein
MSFSLLRCTDMAILVPAFKNLKGFKDVSREPVSASRGCESAAGKSSLGGHSGALDGKVVMSHARKGRVLNHVELNNVEYKYNINGMPHEKWNLRPTIRQCF